MEMSDWSSDVCSSDLTGVAHAAGKAITEVLDDDGPTLGLNSAALAFNGIRVAKSEFELGGKLTLGTPFATVEISFCLSTAERLGPDVLHRFTNVREDDLELVAVDCTIDR